MQLSTLQKHANTFLYVFAALAVRLLVVGILNAYAPYVTFFISTLVVAYRYDLKQGIWACVLGTIAGSFLVFRFSAVAPDQFWNFYLTTTFSFLVTVLGMVYFVHARKIALENEQRIRTEVQNVNRFTDEFLATLSHELRTPLNVIMGYLAIQKPFLFDRPEATKAHQVLQRNADLLFQLVSELLDTSKIITGKVELRYEQVDPADAVQKAVESIRPSAEAKRIGLEVRGDSQCHIWVDPMRLQQIIWNLLSNSIKFTPPQGQILVLTRADDAWCEIEVIDSGKGIAPDFLPHVFDRFRQGDASTTREFSGLGLGLSISKNLAEMQGGELTAYSEGEDRGSKFVLKLPLAPPGAVPERGS